MNQPLMPKYAIGDTVYCVSTQTKGAIHACPDCNDTKMWPVTSPAGESMEMPCPRCQGSVPNDLSLRYTEHYVAVRTMTIGSVRTDTHDQHPISYMCRETGVGSGSVWYEENLYANKEEAEAHGEIERARVAALHAAKPEVQRSFERMNVPYTGAMRMGMADSIRREVIRDLRAEWDQEYDMGTHTKGPWKLSEGVSGDGVYSFTIHGRGREERSGYRDEVTICSGYGGLSDGFASHKEGPANARIFVAALNLLTLAKNTLDAGEIDEHAFKEVIEAAQPNGD